MVAAEAHDLRADVGCRVRVRERPTGEELRIGFLHLPEGELVVEGRDGDVAAVEDVGPGGVGVEARAVVEGAVGGLAGGGGAEGAGAEARAGAVGDGGVEGDAEDGDVVGDGGVGEAWGVGEVGEGADAGEGPLWMGMLGQGEMGWDGVKGDERPFPICFSAHLEVLCHQQRWDLGPGCHRMTRHGWR